MDILYFLFIIYIRHKCCNLSKVRFRVSEDDEVDDEEGGVEDQVGAADED